MKRVSVGNGVYRDEAGAYWARPWVNKRRTWRRLKALKEKFAIAEAANTDFTAKPTTFAELAGQYTEAGCPNKRLERRGPEFTVPETWRVERLVEFFGRFEAAEIRISHLPKYKAWRLRKITRGTGERAVDKECVTLSNVLSYGVLNGVLEFNYIRAGRPKFRAPGQVRHCREVAPPDGDALNRLAEFFFSSPDSEVLGWQLLFSAMTGCRTSELLRLRLDASNPDQPGFLDGDYLFLGRRSKRGVNPWVKVEAEFADMLACFRNWHRARFEARRNADGFPLPDSPWFFPGRHDGQQAVGSTALVHGLNRACLALELPKITGHGCRSYFVTKRRSEGISDAQIAAEIGDNTVSIIASTYGDRPPNWTGGEKLSFLPSEGLPAWRRWAEKKIVVLGKA